jgi:hypothetical protein
LVDSKLVDENQQGEWVKWCDVESFIKEYQKESTYLDGVVFDGVECNCEEMFRTYTGPYPHPGYTKTWICPAHGYKKL